MSKKIVIANWKMNPITYKEAEKLFVANAKAVRNIKKTEVVFCPPVIFLPSLLHLLKAKSNKQKAVLGAQNVFYEEKGAYTGEISAEMVYSIGGRYVILGHSERRSPPAGGGETNEDINKKVRMALSTGLVPIVCIGEKERDENHKYLNFIKEQLEIALKNILKSSLSKVIIAYEPVWAIGKNAIREANPLEFLEMKIFIKKVLSIIFGVKTKMPRIIYGGSVHPKNSEAFLKEGQADGFLVGRDSLDAKKFGEIISVTESIV